MRLRFSLSRPLRLSSRRRTDQHRRLRTGGCEVRSWPRPKYQSIDNLLGTSTVLYEYCTLLYSTVAGIFNQDGWTPVCSYYRGPARRSRSRTTEDSRTMGDGCTFSSEAPMRDYLGSPAQDNCKVMSKDGMYPQVRIMYLHSTYTNQRRRLDAIQTRQTGTTRNLGAFRVTIIVLKSSSYSGGQAMGYSYVAGTAQAHPIVEQKKETSGPTEHPRCAHARFIHIGTPPAANRMQCS